MPVATDAQMQTFSDSRVRPRAEQFRALLNACRDDKFAIDDIYAHAVQQNPTWVDNRTDGPPELLDSADMLTYNTIISLFDKLVLGTLTLQEVTDFKNSWSAFQSACVRPLEV